MNYFKLPVGVCPITGFRMAARNAGTDSEKKQKRSYYQQKKKEKQSVVVAMFPTSKLVAQ